MKQQKPLNPIVPRLHLACLALFGLLPGVLLAQQSNPNVVFSVAPNNQTLYYPSTMQYLPDEHTTIMPVPRLRGEPNARQPAAPDYLFFVAANNSNYGGTFVLKTTDLIHFDFAQNYGSAAVHGNAVMWPPNEFTDCQYTGATVFDQNYAAPGTVLQDPTRPPENFIMIYEAEQHCPAGPGGQFEFPYWASVGLARSSDGGKTWPQPGQYGADRYAAVTLAGTEPPTPHPPWGDAVPSAFIDDVRHKCDDDQEARCKQKGYFIYAVYYFNGSPSLNPDGYMRIARAKLGGDGSRQFKKWYVDPKTKIGGWTEDGIGGLDSGFTPALGCTEPAYQINGQISYIDALRVYLLTYVCARLQRQSDGTYLDIEGSWYYSTATSLQTQNWTSPQLILNSNKPITTDNSGGRYFDGWYPSFMSPGCKPGHLALAGNAFFANGNVVGLRKFNSRTFRIDVGAGTPIADTDCGSRPDDPGPQVGPLKMEDMRQLFQRRQ